MAKHAKVSFNNETVRLDGNHYNDCRFTGCRFVFSGEAPVQMNGCTMSRCTFKLEGPALLTVSFLTQLRTVAGLQGLVDSLLDGIRSGVLPGQSKH
jgi:hypothetical protein